MRAITCSSERLHDRLRPDVVDRLGQPFEAVADDDADILDAAVEDLAQHLVPVLGAFRAIAGPEAEDVPLALEGDADDGVDRPVGDLAVPDLDPDRVNEHNRVDRVERPLCQAAISSRTRSVIRLIVSFDTSDAVHVLEVGGDLAGRQPLRGQRDHDSSTPDNLRCRFLTIFGSKLPSRSRRHSRSPPRRPRSAPSSNGSRCASCPYRGPRFVLRIAEVIVHLDLQRGLQHRLRQIRQQTTRTDQLHTLGASTSDQPLRQARLRRRLPRRRSHIRHHSLPSPAVRPAAQDTAVTPLIGQTPRRRATEATRRSRERAGRVCRAGLRISTGRSPAGPNQCGSAVSNSATSPGFMVMS